MERAVIAILLCGCLAGCGGRRLSPQDASPPDLAERIGPIDLTQAPATLNLSCNAAAGTLDFELPCLVGMNLAGDHSGLGVNVTECRTVQGGRPVAWSFILPLGAIAKDPGMVLHFPDNVAKPPERPFISIHGENAELTTFTGTLSFSRVDPAGRAFIGAITGTAVWKGSSGTETTCDVTGPLWGAPGGFR